METEELLSRQQAIARVTGAIAHELNNPLQGVLALVTVCKSEADRGTRERLEQVHGGLVRLSQIVQSLSAVYENLPREAETISVESFAELLRASFAERSIHTKVTITAPREVRFHALVPETVRLVREAFSLPVPTGGSVHIRLDLTDGRVALICERESSDTAESWGGITDHPVCSGLAVIIDEMTRLAGGEPDFRFDHASLCGIRLCFRIRMN
ncbi:MAG TPA: histidine kinase dimerization/phospho-acceptor domain-containing protein [bacterium]